MTQYLHAGDVEHEGHQPEQQFDSGGSPLPHPRGLVPGSRNQSRKVETWVITRGWNSECRGSWTLRRRHGFKVKIWVSLNFNSLKADSEGDWELKWGAELAILCVRRLPEDGAPVSKHVGVGTYHELRFIICILSCLIKCICWLLYLIVTHKLEHKIWLNTASTVQHLLYQPAWVLTVTMK